MATRKIKLTHPGKILREEFMEPVGLSAYVTASRDIERLAQPTQWRDPSMLRDERESHSDSFAK